LVAQEFLAADLLAKLERLDYDARRTLSSYMAFNDAGMSNNARLADSSQTYIFRGFIFIVPVF